MASELKGETQIEINAPLDSVWDLVSDVTRTPEWSDECYRCDWMGGASRPEVGARFKGYNRHGFFKWSAKCTVTESEPGRVFAFETATLPFKGPQTRWRYQIEAADGGCVLTESFQVLWRYRLIARLMFGGTEKRLKAMDKGLRTTLGRIKAIAEGSGY